MKVTGVHLHFCNCIIHIWIYIGILIIYICTFAISSIQISFIISLLKKVKMERDKDRGFGTDCKSDESYVSAFAFLQLHHSYLHIGHLIIQVAPFTYNLTIYICTLAISQFTFTISPFTYSKLSQCGEGEGQRRENFCQG